MERRNFLTIAAGAAASDPDARYTVEAKFYEKLPYRKIKCKLCPRECVIDDRERGYCGVRENRNGLFRHAPPSLRSGNGQVAQMKVNF